MPKYVYKYDKSLYQFCEIGWLDPAKLPRVKNQNIEFKFKIPD